MGSNTNIPSRVCSFNNTSNLLDCGAAGLEGVMANLLGDAPLEAFVKVSGIPLLWMHC